MKKLLSHFPILGENRQEFYVSLAVVFFGCLLWAMLPPDHGREIDSWGWGIIAGYCRAAGYFIIAVIGLLCALNGYRDKTNTQAQRRAICYWCAVLCLMLLMAASSLLAYWQADKVMNEGRYRALLFDASNRRPARPVPFRFRPKGAY